MGTQLTNIWLEGAPLVTTGGDQKFNIWIEGSPVVEGQQPYIIVHYSLPNDALISSNFIEITPAPPMAISLGNFGEQVQISGIFIESSSFHNQFVLTTGGNLTARTFIETNVVIV